MEKQPDIDFKEVGVRLASYGLRIFAEFGLGGQSATISGVGLSVEDFVWKVLSEYGEGTLAYNAQRGELFSLLAKALRNDIIDALRKAAHTHEEARSPLPRRIRLKTSLLRLTNCQRPVKVWILFSRKTVIGSGCWRYLWKSPSLPRWFGQCLISVSRSHARLRHRSAFLS